MIFLLRNVDQFMFCISLTQSWLLTRSEAYGAGSAKIESGSLKMKRTLILYPEKLEPRLRTILARSSNLQAKAPVT